MGTFITKLKEKLFARNLEMIILGLENSGKTTFMNHLTYGEFRKTVPTIGLNVRTVKQKGLVMKMWDLGGQVHFRSEWAAYAKGCQVMIFVIYASNPDCLPISKTELFQLLEEKELSNVPILILSNKIDLSPHLSEIEIIKGMNLDYMVDNPWNVIPISAKHGTNIDQALDWLLKKSMALNKS